MCGCKRKHKDKINFFNHEQVLKNPDQIMHDSNKEFKADMFAGTNDETERDAQVGNDAEGSKNGNHWKSWKHVLESMLPLPHGNENSISSGGVHGCIREALSLPQAHNTSQVPLKFLPEYIEAIEVPRAKNNFQAFRMD